MGLLNNVIHRKQSICEQWRQSKKFESIVRLLSTHDSSGSTFHQQDASPVVIFRLDVIRKRLGLLVLVMMIVMTVSVWVKNLSSAWPTQDGAEEVCILTYGRDDHPAVPHTP